MTKALRIVAFGVVSGCLAGSAFASTWVEGGVKETNGNNSYNGINAYGEVGLGDFSVKPMFQSFHNSLSSGTFNSYALRLGYDTKMVGVGLTGGATPSVNGYNNKFAGVDATVSITPTGAGARERINGRQQASGPAQGQGLGRLDIGGSAMYTEHTDHFGAQNQPLSHVQRIGQTDLTGSVGVSILESLFSVDVTKSLYDRKPGAFTDAVNIPVRSPRVQNIIGLANVVQGFPNTSVNAKVLFGLFPTPIVKPYAQYTHTTFQAGAPNSNAYTFGMDAELAMLEVSAAFEHYSQVGQQQQNFASIGANIRF